MPVNKAYEVFGHRGARGYFPENTISGFIETVKMGVQWLELDVVISKDKKVVVSHEPWMNSKFCSMPDGKSVKHGRRFNLYNMNYEEIKLFDCGKKTNKDFPRQKSIPCYKPLLIDVIDTTSSLASLSRGRRILGEVKYCIEIKSFKFLERKYHPPVKEFCELVYEIIKEKKISDRVMIISFDARVLQHFHKLDTKIKTGFIFVNLFSVKTNINKIGFIPYSYNPYYKLASKKMINGAHEAGMKVITWTVNNEKPMKQLIKNGADGIMSDYPDIALRLLEINE